MLQLYQLADDKGKPLPKGSQGTINFARQQHSQPQRPVWGSTDKLLKVLITGQKLLTDIFLEHAAGDVDFAERYCSTIVGRYALPCASPYLHVARQSRPRLLLFRLEGLEQSAEVDRHSVLVHFNLLVQTKTASVQTC